MTACLDKILAVVDGLKGLNADLGALFKQHFGSTAILVDLSPLAVYIKLFCQVQHYLLYL